MIKKYLALMPLCMVVSCGEPSPEELVRNDELRRKILEKCTELGVEAAENERCQEAMKAEVSAMGRKVNNFLESKDKKK